MSSKNDLRNEELELEAGSEWISRAEVRALLGVSDTELRELSHGMRLSRRKISLFLKAEIRALADAAKKMR